MIPALKLLRPKQWTKNGFCLAGLAFSGRMVEVAAWKPALAVVACFCAASSAVYALNDVLDRDRDRQHPVKRHRPVASGAVSPGVALGLSGLLMVLAVAGGFAVAPAAGACTAMYLLLNLGYSLGLKHVVFLDVLCIAMGFVLRLLAGVYAVGVLPTVWITLCTFFGAVFLGFAKRRAELANHGQQSLEQRRPVLRHYSVGLLDRLIDSASTLTIVAYSMFLVGGGKSPALVLTVPIVFYAVVHYQRLVTHDQGGEEPETLLLKNRPLQAAMVIWLVAYFVLWKSGNRWFG